MVFCVKLCDIVIQVTTLFSNFYINFKEYNYNKNIEEPSIAIKISYSDIEQEKRIITQYHDDEFHCLWNKWDEKYLESQAVYRKIADEIPRFNAFLIHGVALEKDNKGYIFVAPSGVGKTTRAQIWLKEYPDSIIVNGDKPFIKVTKREAIVYGSPWCGKEKYNENKAVPLSAVFFLERADHKRNNKILDLKFSEAFPLLFQQTYHPVDRVALCNTLKLLREMEGKVRFYRMISYPSAESIRLAYETANGR